MMNKTTVAIDSLPEGYAELFQTTRRSDYISDAVKWAAINAYTANIRKGESVNIKALECALIAAKHAAT